MENSPSHSHHSESNPSHYSSYTNSYNNLVPNDEMGILRAKYKHSNNKVYHDFYKTKVCSLYNLNICKKGNECPFAHSAEELRDKPDLHKTQLCEAFLQGQCEKGEDCTFAHTEEELRSTPDLFKTALCHLWSQGKCTNGENCRFAHGYDDLRPAPSHKKFKKTNVKKPYNKKPKQQHQNQQEYQSNPRYDSNFYYNNQYPYPANMYGYPMYSMPMMMPENLQGNYMMSQPYGLHGGANPSISK